MSEHTQRTHVLDTFIRTFGKTSRYVFRYSRSNSWSSAAKCCTVYAPNETHRRGCRLLLLLFPILGALADNPSRHTITPERKNSNTLVRGGTTGPLEFCTPKITVSFFDSRCSSLRTGHTASRVLSRCCVPRLELRPDQCELSRRIVTDTREQLRFSSRLSKPPPPLPPVYQLYRHGIMPKHCPLSGARERTSLPDESPRSTSPYILARARDVPSYLPPPPTSRFALPHPHGGVLLAMLLLPPPFAHSLLVRRPSYTLRFPLSAVKLATSSPPHSPLCLPRPRHPRMTPLSSHGHMTPAERVRGRGVFSTRCRVPL